MSPLQIVDAAIERGLEIIAITDHNHTGNCKVIRELGAKRGLWVVYGVEVTSQEDVHCLAFFDTDEQLSMFQEYIDQLLPVIANDTTLFGQQLIVDAEERILEEITHSLYPGLNAGIDDIAARVRELGGYFVPAHIDRTMNGLYSQLGFFPVDLEVDAVEIFRKTSRSEIRVSRGELEAYQILKSSDAHFIEDVGRCTSQLVMMKRDFAELGMALRGENNRRIEDA